MANLIQKTDTLNQGREKLNAAITDAEKAKTDAGSAVSTSNQAKQIAQTAEHKADSVQAQFDQVVIEGDSSVEAAAARVDTENVTHPTLKARLDAEYTKVRNKTIGTVNIKEYEEYKDGIDWTPAFNKLVEETPEGYKIVFPTDEYTGNYITQKSYDMDFQDSLTIPADPNLPIVQFKGTVEHTRNVIGNPKYGDLSFELDDLTGLIPGDIGYLVDEAIRPSDNSPNVNVELIKIKSIHGNIVTVYDMIRSNQNTGQVKFVKVLPLKNPRVRNLQIQATDDHTFPCVYFYACENTFSENVETANSTGHAVRHELVYNWTTNNIKVIKPKNTGGGQGYGITADKSRNGYIINPYGIGTRHLIDFNSSYNCHAERVIEEDGKSSVVVLAHNGYGGNNSVHDVICTTDSYAVNWSSQGIVNRDLQVMRDVTITKIKHTLPTIRPDQPSNSISIYADYDNLMIDDIETFYVDDSVAPSSSSQVVRLSGNMMGPARVENVDCNTAGAAVWADVRSTKGLSKHVLIINNISADKTEYAVRLRGINIADIDNVTVTDSCLAAVMSESLNGVTPFGLSLGDNIHVPGTKIFAHSGLPSIGLRGRYPRLTNNSTTSVTVSNGASIDLDKLINSGGFLTLVAPVGDDVTLNSSTPFAAPLWIGQEITLVINGIGSTGRGNVIIPSGTSTYDISGGTLQNGRIYKLVGYNGRWRVVG